MSERLRVTEIGTAVEVRYKKPGDKKIYRHKFGGGVKLSTPQGDNKVLIIHGGGLRVSPYIEG